MKIIINKKESLINKCILFVASRLLSCLVIYLFLPFYDQRFFTFKDLDFYQGSSDFFTPNFLFAYLVKVIGYDANTIHSWNYFVLCILISIIIFLPWIFLSHKILNNRNSYIYSIILGLHPYLALYSFKFDSTNFAVLPIALIALEKLLPSIKLKYLSLLTSTLSSFFRSQVLVLAWIQLIFFYSNNFFKFSKRNIFLFIIFLLLVFCSITQFNYGADILTQNFGCYSLINIKSFFIDKGFNESISSYISVLVTPIIHVFLLLGAREAISAYCLYLPSEIASNYGLNILSSFLFLSFHLYALIRLIMLSIFNKKEKELGLLIPLIILLPNLYGSAHMRYIICLIPYITIFIFNIKNKK